MSFKYGWWGVGGGRSFDLPNWSSAIFAHSTQYPNKEFFIFPTPDLFPPLFSLSIPLYISLTAPPSHSLFPHQLFIPLASSCDFSHPYVSPMGNILFPMYFITNISHYILLSLCAFFLLFLSSPSHYFPTPSSSKIDDAPHLS